MSEFIIYLFQSALCLSVFLLVYSLLLRGRTFFRFNRLFLLLGLLLSFAIPAIELSYDVIIPMVTRAEIPLIETIGEPLVEETISVSIWDVFSFVYFFGIIFVMAKNINVCHKLRNLKQTGTTYSREGINIVRNNTVGTPFSFFSSIYINNEKLQPKEEEIILKHEISHIKQRHWVDLLCSECALLLQWFNPLMWYYIKLLKENHEYLADEAVLNSGESAAIYRAVLINQQFQGPVFSFSNSFNNLNNKNRLNMMKKMKTSPWKKIAALAVLPFVGIFLALNAKPNYVFAQEPTGQLISLEDSIINKKSMSEDKTLFLGGDLENQPLIIVDDKEVPNINDMDTRSIDKFVILQDASETAVYGEKGKNGVLIITTKKEATHKEESNITDELEMRKSSSNAFDFLHRKIDPKNPPLMIIDNKEVSNMDNLNMDDIDSFSILKDASATTVYGEKGKNGVVIIKTKKAATKQKKYTFQSFGSKEDSIDGQSDKSGLKTMRLDHCIIEGEEVEEQEKPIVELTEKKEEKDASEFWIRGIGAFDGTDRPQPLIFIDGKEVSSMDNLNTDDIDSFSILKDASATAVYGEKGKDGVILIVTKKEAAKQKGQIKEEKKSVTSKSGEKESSSLQSLISYMYSEKSHGVFSPTNIVFYDLLAGRGNPKNSPLIFIDDKEVPNLDNFNRDDMHKYSILEGAPVTDAYGEKGKNGVILITTKKEAAKQKEKLKDGAYLQLDSARIQNGKVITKRARLIEPVTTDLTLQGDEITMNLDANLLVENWK